MTFLAGAFLPLLALGSIPILIHLLNRRRFKVVEWAAMRFLLATIRRNARRLQMRDLILLILRTLAILALALAVSRPTVAPGAWGLLGRPGDLAAVIVLDHSLSMGYLAGQQTRFERAKGIAKDLLRHLPPQALAAFLLLSDKVQDVVPVPSRERGVVEAEMDRATLSGAGTSFSEGLLKAVEVLESVPAASREIYLLSDMQAQGWPDPKEPAWKKALQALNAARPPIHLFLVNAGDGRTENLHIESFGPEDELATASGTVAFQVQLRQRGEGRAGPVKVELWEHPLDGEPRPVATAQAGPFDQTCEIRLEKRFERGGIHRLEARAGADALTEDNRRFLSLHLPERLRVLLVEGEAEEKGDPFSGATAFLKAAINPFDPEAIVKGGWIECQSISPLALPDTDWRDFQTVVLANVPDLSREQAEALKVFVHREGGGLIFFGGGQVDVKRMNERLVEQAALLPALLQPPALVPQPSADAFGLSTRPLTHPVVSFFAHKDHQGYLAQPRFWGAHGLLPLPALPEGEGKEPEVREVLGFSKGGPVLLERRRGRGRVLLFASSADKDWNDLPLYPAYLILARRMVQYAGWGLPARRTVTANGRIMEMTSLNLAGAEFLLSDPRGAPHRLRSVPTPQGEWAFLESLATSWAGFYDLRGPAGRFAPVTFAVNPPPSESDLEPLGEGALRQRYPGLAFTWIQTSEQLRAKIQEARSGKEWWMFLLILAALCLLSEAYLAARWSPKEG